MTHFCCKRCIFALQNINILNLYAIQYYKKNGKILATLVKNYFQDIYTEHFTVFDDLEVKLGIRDFNQAEENELKRLVSLFFLGQLVGLPTLNSILVKYGISNGRHQRNYKKICEKLSPSVLKGIFEDLFERELATVLRTLGLKHRSCLSRDIVTVILDDSVFKHWSTISEDALSKFEDFYGCFFSGQCRRAVFGFKVVTLGVSINEVFYPLYCEFVKAPPAKKVIEKLPKQAKNIKKEELSSTEKRALKIKKIQEKEQKKAEKQANDLLVFSGEKADFAISVAIKLVKRFSLWKRKLGQKDILLPDFYFSCDSGYSHELLEKVCVNNHLRYISVVKKVHNFQVDGKQIKATDLIKTMFLEAERKHQEQESNLPKKEKTPFSLRIRANYCCKDNQRVVLLIFRLNGSNKVSIIYTTHLEIMSKTLRRHWFARTYIEQFFKTLKHVLKIHQTITKTKASFEIKLSRFCFVALHAQKLIKTIRKETKDFEKKGFIALQRILNNEKIIINLLQKYVK